MTTYATRRIHRFARLLRAIVAASVVLGAATAAHAHGPDPALSGVFDQDQALRFAWLDGAVPPVAVRNAIVAAATDANATRASRAPRFILDAKGTNPIGYGVGATCGPNGIACYTRKAPKAFTMWLREHGRVFDWGVLRWCQMQAIVTDGCFDAENIALDEFGHVTGLDHHVNLGNETDYLDAVVQTFSRTRPRDGWNVHRYGRCDVARLQTLYDVPDASTKVSTCLDLATKLTIAASATTVPYQGTVTLTATLKVGTSTAYGKLSANVLDARVVTLERRSVGVTTWTTIGPMAPGPTSGTYRLGSTVITDVEYRAVFHEPADEGLDASNSPTVRVLRGSCSKACPAAAPAPGRRGGPVNRPRSDGAAIRAILILVATLVLGGCADGPASPAPTATDPPVGPGAEPPVALLLLRDQPPVAGQLGTYTWRDDGSSSPWLPGARAAVPANEALRFQFAVAVPISRWNVRYVEIGSDGPSGAVVLGEGLIRGRVLESDVMPRGEWTVELHVSFANRLGNAAYFWEITVR